jgi:tetratricopeptide (TPR) repeat protein/Zn ribbon nucleic-acid-binding protein
MVKFCPGCGYKLVQEFKFCPECGFELQKVNKDLNAEEHAPVKELKEKGFVKKIVCDNCGEENDIENIVCSGCGVKLAGPGNVKTNPAKQEENIALSTNLKPAAKSANTPKIKIQPKAGPNTKVKSLNKAATITIVAAGVGIALVILMFSGLLNSLITPGNTPVNAGTNLNSGINLSSIQKINDLADVVKNNPQDTASILELANLQNDAGMFEQAIINYKQYLSFVPKDPAARIDLGICYYNLQNFDAAISEMEQALKYDSKMQIGYLNLGIVNLAAGKMELSQEWLKKAVAIDPNSENGKKAQELLSSHNNQINGGK